MSLFILILWGVVLSTFANPPTSPYGVSQNITDPSCPPGGTNCYVDVVTADNGLTATGGNVSLGGTLTGDTTVDQSGFDFSIMNGDVGYQSSSDILGLGQPGIGMTYQDGNMKSMVGLLGNMVPIMSLQADFGSNHISRVITLGEPGGMEIEISENARKTNFSIDSGSAVLSAIDTNASQNSNIEISYNNGVEFSFDGNSSSYVFPRTGGTAGQVLTTNGNGQLSWETPSGGGGGSPAGSDTQIQYNNAGAFGASSDFIFDQATSTFTATNNWEVFRTKIKFTSGGGTNDLTASAVTAFTGTPPTTFAVLAFGNIQIVNYINLVGGNFYQGDTITGSVSGAEGYVAYDDGAGQLYVSITNNIQFATGDVIDNANGVTADYDTSTTSDDIFFWYSTAGGSGGPTVMTGASQVLDDGISITFGSVTGHGAGDSWEWSYKTLKNTVLSNRKIGSGIFDGAINGSYFKSGSGSSTIQAINGFFQNGDDDRIFPLSAYEDLTSGNNADKEIAYYGFNPFKNQTDPLEYIVHMRKGVGIGPFATDITEFKVNTVEGFRLETNKSILMSSPLFNVSDNTFSWIGGTNSTGITIDDVNKLVSIGDVDSVTDGTRLVVEPGNKNGITAFLGDADDTSFTVTDISTGNDILSVSTNNGNPEVLLGDTSSASITINSNAVGDIVATPFGGKFIIRDTNAFPSTQLFKIDTTTKEVGIGDVLAGENYISIIDAADQVFVETRGTMSLGNSYGGNNTKITIDDIAQTINFNNNYSFPFADGAAGQVLGTDGSGQLGWVTVSGGSVSPISIGTSGNTLYSSGLSGTGQGDTSTGSNIFLGDYAGNGATDAYNSNFFGNQAGNSATNASDSNFFGQSAGYGATGAYQSNFFGPSAGQNATNASYSNFLGQNAGYGANNASNSIFIGKSAGNSDLVNNTGSLNDFSILIGPNTSTGNNGSGVGYSNSIALGGYATNTASNQFMIGSSTRPINQIVMVASGGTTCATDINGTACSSDERLKTNITDLTTGILDKVVNTKTVTFNWNNNTDTTSHIGFIAQDIQQYFPELVSTGSTGYLSVNYAGMTPVLVQAIREMNLHITELSNMERPNTWRDSLIAWFESTTNGIRSLVVHDKICVDDQCLTKDDIKVLLQMKNGSTGSVPNSPPSDNTPPTPDPLVCTAPQVLNQAGDTCIDPEPTQSEETPPIETPSTEEPTPTE